MGDRRQGATPPDEMKSDWTAPKTPKARAAARRALADAESFAVSGTARKQFETRSVF
jgi:hypothetical protein